MDRKTFPTPANGQDVRALMDHQKAAFNEKKQQASTQGADIMQERTARYLTRWREALAYVDSGAAVLDIGSGWLPPPVCELITRRFALNYHAFDIDPLVISEMTEEMGRVGLPPENFKSGEVAALPFERKFDLVFSSHCLEHAIDIVRTLKEVRRVLKSGGLLFMSVPLGFDTSDEHLLFHGPQEWIEMLSALGFEVIAHTVGRVYAPEGDVTILARASDVRCDDKRAHDIASRFSKAGRTLLTSKHAAFSFPAGARHEMSHSIMSGLGAKCEIVLPEPPRALIVERHGWSGCVEISDGSSRICLDAMHPIHHKHGIDLLGFGKSLTVEVVGKNPLSRGYECVVAGALI